MIFTVLINVFASIIGTSITWALPPAASVPTSSAMYVAFEQIFTFAYQWDYLVPVSELMAIMGLAVLFWVVVGALNGVLWVIHLIRGN